MGFSVECLLETGRSGSIYCNLTNLEVSMGFRQGWEFAHRFSGQIARFLPKIERMSDSLIRSFLVSDMSDLLTIANFLRAM